MTFSPLSDPTVHLKISEQFKVALREIYDSTECKESIPRRIVSVICGKGYTMTVEDVKWVWKNMFSDSPMAENFYKVLRDSDLILPAPQLVPRNPELEARITRLKVDADEKEYQDMTKNVDSVRHRHPEDSIAYQVKEMNRELIAVLQLVISVAAGFAFGYVSVSLATPDFGARLFAGLFCALTVGVADLYFLCKKISDIPDAKKKS